MEITTLLDGFEKEAGFHAVIWDGRNHIGQSVSNGFYILLLQADQTVLSMKMTLIK